MMPDVWCVAAAAAAAVVLRDGQDCTAVLTSRAFSSDDGDDWRINTDVVVTREKLFGDFTR